MRTAVTLVPQTPIDQTANGGGASPLRRFPERGVSPASRSAGVELSGVPSSRGAPDVVVVVEAKEDAPASHDDLAPRLGDEVGERPTHDAKRELVSRCGTRPDLAMSAEPISTALPGRRRRSEFDCHFHARGSRAPCLDLVHKSSARTQAPAAPAAPATPRHPFIAARGLDLVTSPPHLLVPRISPRPGSRMSRGSTS